MTFEQIVAKVLEDYPDAVLVRLGHSLSDQRCRVVCYKPNDGAPYYDLVGYGDGAQAAWYDAMITCARRKPVVR